MGDAGPSNADFHEGAEEKDELDDADVDDTTALQLDGPAAGAGPAKRRGGLLGRLLPSRRGKKYGAVRGGQAGRGLKGLKNCFGFLGGGAAQIFLRRAPTTHDDVAAAQPDKTPASTRLLPAIGAVHEVQARGDHLHTLELPARRERPAVHTEFRTRRQPQRQDKRTGVQLPLRLLR